MTCEHCGSEAKILGEAGFWEDEHGNSYWYPQVINTRDFSSHPPGRWQTKGVCWRCRLSLGYNFAVYDLRDGVFHVFADDELFDSIAAQSAKGRSSKESTSAPHRRSFPYRVLQSSIAAEVVRTLFKECGYEVKLSGYESVLAEWSEAMKAGDPNSVSRRIRNTPDFLVYDRQLNNMYEVEVKATELNPSMWRYSKSRLDSLRHDFPQAVLVVYAQRTHQVYVQQVQAIDWDSTPVQRNKDGEFYQLSLDGFAPPHQLFRLITSEKYLAFLEDSRPVLLSFQPQD